MSEMVVHPQFASRPAANENRANGRTEGEERCGVPSGAALMRQSLETRSDVSCASDKAESGTGGVPSLSRRETLILRMLMQGASNKVIARNLVITESTVKVHMKAILRKLRLQNRTQAAIWARNNVNEDDWNLRAASAGAAH
jgi:two-component system nitrate/nitrite response regulator NarL